ncbi:MAG TPA: hypothetical protein DDY78_26840 [Planctomycetales bacterium]|jgi:hypothetical protein|nr:hypothetical protein [Planctomycetales bacterium]
MAFVGTIVLLKVRQSPWPRTPAMRRPTNGRTYRRFNLARQAAVGAQVVAAYYDILSCPSQGRRGIEINLNAANDHS